MYCSFIMYIQSSSTVSTMQTFQNYQLILCKRELTSLKIEMKKQNKTKWISLILSLKCSTNQLTSPCGKLIASFCRWSLFEENAIS